MKFAVYAQAAVPVEAWYFKNSAQKKCPGLPDESALNYCADVFVNAETFTEAGVFCTVS
jgi:hypothetical protein